MAAAEDRSEHSARVVSRLFTIVVAALFTGSFFARWAVAADAASGSAHVDPFSLILLVFAAVVVVAMIGRWAAVAFNQPSVLGELLIGVLVGNLGYWLGNPLCVLIMQLANAQPLSAQVWITGLSVGEAARHIYSSDQLAPGGIGAHVIDTLTGPEASQRVNIAFALWIFSNLGVIFLLFMAGLGSTVTEMLAVGPRALAVAVTGIIAPFALGVGASRLLIHEAPLTVDLFLGATLCATSVGITARVFKDLDKLQTPEARIILGAAVIDDILGLIVLAIVVGLVSSGGFQLGEVVRITVLSAVFLGAVIMFGERLVKSLVPVMSALDRHNVKLLFPLALACALSWLASTIELATIVGAFAAGLILNEEHFPTSAGQATVREMIHPLEAIFAPVFFVLMGMQVDLSTFASPTTIGIALGLTMAAVLGKWVCGLPSGPGIDRMTVGVGMIPRGEVGLIFASVGKGLGVIDEALFSAVVMMVIATTLMAPLLLKWSLARR